MSIWEIFCLKKQQFSIKKSKFKKQLKSIISENIYEKSRLYELKKNSHKISFLLLSAFTDTCFLLTHIISSAWKQSDNLMRTFDIENSNNKLLQSLLFWFYYSCIFWSASLPLFISKIFVLKYDHHLAIPSIIYWFKKQLMKFIIFQFISGIVLMSLIWICEPFYYCFLTTWLFTIIIVIFISYIHQKIIRFIVYKFTKLPADVKNKLNDLALYDNDKLCVFDEPYNMAHANFYMYCFYKQRRNIIFDILVGAQCGLSGMTTENVNLTKEEIIALQIHEMAHYKYKHHHHGLFYAMLIIGLNLGVVSLLRDYQPIFDEFQIESSENKPYIVLLVITFVYIMRPINKMFMHIMNKFSKQCEVQADEFCHNNKFGNYLKTAIIKIHKYNLVFPGNKYYSSNYQFGYPPLLERLDFFDKKIN
ncbi:hypothetical protein HCN44_007090 [Aphidius gifuensis]|uniref:Ste24 endopeptidase n=1 Tax=Aphidius gifuensis TaxID=684658 RepID=A0A834XP28_APHGI|nr:hypothetical protein HCN44_007090 [Aphidius gifuensis]